MSRWPELVELDKRMAPGVLSAILFVVLVAIFLTTSFDEMAGFPDGISITSEIGYAMFGFDTLQSGEGAIAQTENFLAAFLLIAVVLDAALDASLVLAKREDHGESVAPASYETTATAGTGGVAAADGGRPAETDGGSATAPSERESAGETGGDRPTGPDTGEDTSGGESA